VLTGIAFRGYHWTIGITPTWGSAWAATTQGPEERFSRPHRARTIVSMENRTVIDIESDTRDATVEYAFL